MKSKAYYLDIPPVVLEWLYKEAEERQISLGKLIQQCIAAGVLITTKERG